MSNMFIKTETGKVVACVDVSPILQIAIDAGKVVKIDNGYRVVKFFYMGVNNGIFGHYDIMFHEGFSILYSI